MTVLGKHVPEPPTSVAAAAQTDGMGMVLEVCERDVERKESSCCGVTGERLGRRKR